MPSSSIEVKGIRAMVDRLKSLSPEMKSRANDFIREEAEDIAQAARDMVPVDSGKLRDSIRVEQAGLSQGRESSSGRFTSSGDISISVVAGGSDIPYALAVHEYPSQHNPPTWNGKPVTFSPSGSGAKFIEHPLAQASRGMAKRIREKVFAGVMIAGVILSGLASASAHPLTDDYFQISGISSLAFGAKAWREPVASVVLLPTSGNLTGDTRLVLDSLTIRVWNGSAWVQGAAGPQGATGAQGPQGPAGEDGQDGADGADGQPRQLQDEGIDLTIRPKVNMIGSSITCVDNSGQSRTDCTVTSSGGSISVPGVGSELLYRLDSDELAALTNSSVTGSDITIPGQLIFLSGLRLKNSSGEFDVRNAADDEFTSLRTIAIALRRSNSNSAILHSDKSLGLMFASDFPIVWWSGSSAGNGSATTRLDRDSDSVLKLSDALKLNSRSSPPVTCGSAGSESVIYYDTSHALCICGTSTWHNLTPSDGGSCS